MKKKWTSLTTDEEGAAIELGFNEERWYMNSRHFGTANYTFSSEVKFVCAPGCSTCVSFSSAEVRFHRMDGQTLTYLCNKIFHADEEEKYKEFVLQYCDTGENNVRVLMSSLHSGLVHDSNMYFWREIFESFHPGLDTFDDMMSNSLRGYNEVNYPTKENTHWT
jgi:hypothetical protein